MFLTCSSSLLFMSLFSCSADCFFLLSVILSWQFHFRKHCRFLISLTSHSSTQPSTLLCGKIFLISESIAMWAADTLCSSSFQCLWENSLLSLYMMEGPSSLRILFPQKNKSKTGTFFLSYLGYSHIKTPSQSFSK